MLLVTVLRGTLGRRHGAPQSSGSTRQGSGSRAQWGEGVSKRQAGEQDVGGNFLPPSIPREVTLLFYLPGFPTASPLKKDFRV